MLYFLGCIFIFLAKIYMDESSLFVCFFFFFTCRGHSHCTVYCRAQTVSLLCIYLLTIFSVNLIWSVKNSKQFTSHIFQNPRSKSSWRFAHWLNLTGTVDQISKLRLGDVHQIAAQHPGYTVSSQCCFKPQVLRFTFVANLAYQDHVICLLADFHIGRWRYYRQWGCQTANRSLTQLDT